MRYFTGLFLILVAFNLNAQIKGNKKIITKTFPLETLINLEMNLYADVLVDCAAEETITITADENLLDLIDFSIDNGKMMLTQKDWIKSSEAIKISIGAPNLQQIQNTVHESVWVKNINRSNFIASAILGKLQLEGKADHLSANAELGEVDATALSAETVQVNLWDRGQIKLGEPQQITGKVKEDGQLVYQGNPTVDVRAKNGGRIHSENEAVRNPDARFIEFKVKNNSLARIQCYVKGPKPDGSSFSYGFPMNPGQVRKKNWSVGTKVYKVSKLGTRKLLAKIEAADEGEVVKLY